jgi:phosphoglucosamine mutase
VIAKDSLQRGRLKGGGVVGTQMSNYGLEMALKKEGIQFARSKVGDRYVMEMLQEKNWQLGGEASGHIIWLSSTTTGDGIVAGLQVLAVMQNSGKSLRELLKGMEKFPQLMINVPLSKAFPPSAWDKLNAEIKAIEAKLKDSGRVLIRASGTEPLIRVMVEGQDQAKVQEYTEYLAEQVKVLAA